MARKKYSRNMLIRKSQTKKYEVTKVENNDGSISVLHTLKKKPSKKRNKELFSEKTPKKNDFIEFNKESILSKKGYVVGNNGESFENRMLILNNVYKSKEMTHGQILKHIKLMIRLNKDIPSKKNAVEQWELDLLYVENKVYQNIKYIKELKKKRKLAR